MAENAFVKIGTALLKHQVKKLVGDETLEMIGEELADIGGDKLDAWLGDKSTVEEIEKAAQSAQTCFREKVTDNEIQQWMVSLPLGNLPKVVEAIDELPSSPNESKLEIALRESIALNWKKLSSEQVDNAVNSFLSCLRSALLPIEKQTLMVIGREVLKTGEKVDKLIKLVEQLKPYSSTSPSESRFISIGGNIGKSVVISGDNNIVYYYADGEKRELRTGWFFGHRYGDLAAFTGRMDELKMLDEWLANKTESLLIINAFGGFGKSALTWHWLNNNVDNATWQTAIWWSFYEKESGFDSFLAEALTHLGMETKERSSRQQVNDLLDTMQKTNMLIVLDGFERLLRQYGRMDAALQDDEEDAEIDPSQRDCTSQPAEVFLRGLSDKKIISKVLMTSRLFPRALESKDGKLQRGCREINLKGFSPNDADVYFHNEGVAATRAEIIEVCSAYGYHPLSLSLLVGWINREDGNEHRGDIMEAKNLDKFDDIKARRDHVLDRAYGSLASERRDLLSKISCFRGSMEYAVLKKVFPSPDLDKALLDLRKRGLLQYTGETQRYDMHPIVRHYAYDHFTDEKRRKEAHVQLAEHFIDVMPVTSRNVKTLEDLTPVIELYHHLVGAGNFDEALKLFYDRLHGALYYQFGAYQLIAELLRALFPDGEDAPPRLKRYDFQGWTFNALANTYSMSGQPHRAIPIIQNSVLLLERIADKGIDDKRNVASGLGNMAIQQLVSGALSAAERNHFRCLALGKEIDDEFRIARTHQELGLVWIYCGNWEKSKEGLDAAISITTWKENLQGYCVNFVYRTLCFLLMAREEAIFDTRKLNEQSRISNNELLQSAIESAQRALALAKECEKKMGILNVYDFIDAYRLLGASFLADEQFDQAESCLVESLSRCRTINLVTEEAGILLNFARLRYVQGNFKDAQEKAEEALIITERCGYVLQGADVNLFLAQYALEQEKDKAKAKVHAEEALKLATCDGPPYYYKVAYEEAERFLAKL